MGFVARANNGVAVVFVVDIKCAATLIHVGQQQAIRNVMDGKRRIWRSASGRGLLVGRQLKFDLRFGAAGEGLCPLARDLPILDLVVFQK